MRYSAVNIEKEREEDRERERERERDCLLRILQSARGLKNVARERTWVRGITCQGRKHRDWQQEK
jgi:hypothetical protein